MAKAKAQILAVAVVRDAADFVGRLRFCQVIERSLYQSVIQWFSVEEAATGAAHVVIVKPSQRFLDLISAASADEADNNGVQGAAGSQDSQGVGFGGVEPLTGEIVVELHRDLLLADLLEDKHVEKSEGVE